MRARVLRGSGLVTLLVGCIHGGGPPHVTPSGKLTPRSDEEGPRTAAEFAVVFSGPTGSLTTRDDAIVTVLFNRAMRSLDDAEDANVPAATLKSKDGKVIPGHFRWVGTRGLVFEPGAGELPGATELEVVVPAGTKALDGAALAHEHKFSFDTPRPQVLSAPFAGRTDLLADGALRLRFDQRIEPADAQKQLELRVRKKIGVEKVAFTVRRATGPLPAGQAPRTIELVPSVKLPLDSAIEVVVPKSFRASEGALGTLQEQVLAARTYGPIRLTDIRCAKQALGRCLAKREIAVVLSNPVARKELLAHLAVVGGEPAKLLVAKNVAPVSTQHTVVAQPTEGKRYKVTIRKGLRDAFGQVLDKDLVFEVATEAAYVGGPKAVDPKKPVEDEATPEDEPILQGVPGPIAGAPHRPKLDFQAQIGLRGLVVEANAKDGIKSHKVPVGIVNLPTVGFWSGKLQDVDVVRWLGAQHTNAPTGTPWSWDWYTPGVAENVRAVRTFDLDALTGGRGAALLAVSVPGQPMPFDTALVTVTDLAISARMSKFGGLVWVTKLSNGQPVANANVRIVRIHPTKKKPSEAFNGTTDANGLLTIPAESYDPIGAGHDAIAIVKAGEDWTFSRVEQGKAALSSYWDVDLSAQATYKALLFTERGVYRPGETMKLAGIVRKGSAKGLEAPAGKDVKLRISDGEGNELVATRAKLDAFGTFAVDVVLTKTAKLGTGTISGTIGTSDSIASTSFLLAAYKASAFKVGVEPAKPAYIHGDDASFAISGEYLYGAVMSGARVHAEITRAPVSFEPPKSEGFVFGETEPRGYVASYLERVDVDLDDKGHHEQVLKLDLKGQNGPERVTIETEVIDPTNQSVAKSASTLVHPAEFYLGLERGGSRFVNLAGGSLEVQPKVAAFEPSGARRSGVAVTLELVQRKWTSNVTEQPDGSPSTWSKPTDQVVGTCSVVTTAATATCPIVVKEPGYYFIKGRAKDPRGNEAKVGTTIWVVAEKADTKVAPAWSKSDLKVVQLEADKSVYKPGEKAKLLVHNPFPTSKEVTALVTVERGGVLDRQLVKLEGAMPVVEIPVKSEWFPNAFVSVDVVRGRIKAPPLKGADLGGPEFRVGTTELKIDPESHRLKLAITPTKQKLSPGETFDADVAVTDDAGKPTKASVTFYAVDEGVLMLTGYRTPDPLPPFAERQKLAVFGFDSREHLARILPMKAGEKVPILGWEYPSKDGWEKGSEYGDGGDGGSTPRMDFRATAFFEAGRVTTDDGHAKFHVKLPDNLTSYRLMAVAATGDDRFGFGESNITASKKLMIRPALPRAVRVGDAFEASMVLTSKDLPATDVEVTLKATGLVVDGPTSFHAQVGPNQQVPVRFKVKATAAGTASLDVEAKGGGATDHLVLSRTVSLPLAMKTVAAYGATTSAAALDLGNMEGARPDQGGLKVKVASSALVGLDTSFDRLIEYPYGCTEQLVSRTLPLLTLRDLGKQAGVRMPAKTDAVIDDAIAKTLAHQGYDGGFGYWEDDGSVPWLSAYTTWMLEEASKRGHAVPKDASDRAVGYLRQILPSNIPPAEGEVADAKDDDSAVEDDAAGPVVVMSPTDANGLKFANGAFLVDALASSGAADPGSMNRLYDVRSKKPLFAQALLLHAMAVGKMPQAQLQTFAKELEERLKVDANTATAMPEGPVYAPMLDSATRTTALTLRALLAVDAKHALAPRLARGLLDARVDGAWRSTQENVWALAALDAYRTAQESSTAAFEARVFVGDTELGHAALKGVQEEAFTLATGKLPKNGPLTVTMEGQGKMFWSAELRYATTVLPQKPFDHGFFVEKRVRGIAPGDLDAALKVMPKTTVSKVKVGELVLVDLLLETAEARDQVVIDDPLPAGVEPLDVRLETVAKSQDVGDGPFLAHASKKAGFSSASVHREHHDDRVLTFLGHVEPGLYHFRYVARATSAGTFVVPPTTVEAMYAPEVNGRTRATTFTISKD